MTKLFLIVAAVLLVTGGFVVYHQESNRAVNDTSNPEVSTGVEKQTTDVTDTVATTQNEESNGGGSRTLSLSGQGLVKTPGYVFERTNLEELNLSNNQLDGSLPGEVRFLQNLKILNLSNNNFTGVPAEIGQLKNLEVLDLSNNDLTGLPNELGNLSNLRVLKLKGNDYSASDLNNIQQKLSSSVVIETD